LLKWRHMARRVDNPYSTGLEIRAARLEDLEAISVLEQRVWRELAASPQDLRRRFLQFPRGLQAAYLSTQLVGFCCSVLTDLDAAEVEVNERFPWRHVPQGRNIFLLGLTVDPEVRRLGIGSALVRQELELAKEQGCRKVQLVANSMSRVLFQRLGLKVVHPLPHLFREFPKLIQDPVLMELVLSMEAEERRK
jgi:ribosomal protein S18 acetylase RimI-like enzyme